MLVTAVWNVEGARLRCGRRHWRCRRPMVKGLSDMVVMLITGCMLTTVENPASRDG